MPRMEHVQCHPASGCCSHDCCAIADGTESVRGVWNAGPVGHVLLQLLVVEQRRVQLLRNGSRIHASADEDNLLQAQPNSSSAVNPPALCLKRRVKVCQVLSGAGPGRAAACTISRAKWFWEPCVACMQMHHELSKALQCS